MKLTDKHISDDKITYWLNRFQTTNECFLYHQEKDFILALLELKQRRAEDRAKVEAAP
jgi:hypothetical protein